MHEAHRVATLARKRANPPEMRHMDADEVKALFDSLSTTGRLALRDHCLIQFLYNTGARAQEVCDLRVSHLELGSMPRVHLHGKGDKWRTCPLWTQTARMLEKLLASEGEALPETPVFLSARKRDLTCFGIHKPENRVSVNFAVRVGHFALAGQSRFPIAARLTRTGVACFS
jgi:integrase